MTRFTRVIDHIDANLSDPLDGEILADIAAYSRFHFHRQFAALFGLGVGRYVQLARFHRAAQQLAFRPQKSVLTIALECGFESPEAFSKAFKKWHGQSPSDFRQTPNWDKARALYQPLIDARHITARKGMTMPHVEIIDFPQTRVATLRHHGDPAFVGDSIRRFIAWRKRHALPPHKYATYNIVHSNPNETPPDAFMFDLCVATRITINQNPEGIFEQTIPSLRCARVRHTGPDHTLNDTILPVFAHWMPQTGENAGDYPIIFHRLSLFPDVVAPQATTDIYIPLA
ncbi:hypothetical protein LF95_17085 [Thalassospira sp. TSL5-1]|nr:hypothetical protein LF95_17085 [Thalassospira sp. TSL5-1]